MPSSIVHGRYLVTRAREEGSTIIEHGALYQRDGVIVDVGPFRDIAGRYTADHVIGGREFIVLPGLVNAHHHGRGVSTFLLGTADSPLEVWTVLGWARRPIDQYLQGLYTAAQLLESGTTTLMYNHPTSGPFDQLDDEIHDSMRAYEQAGLRVALSVLVRNQNRTVYAADEEFLATLPQELAGVARERLETTRIPDDEYFDLFRRLYGRYALDPRHRTRVLLSPANVQWCTDDFLARTREVAREFQTGIHIHLAETIYQKEYALRTWGKTPAAHLMDLGFLGPDLSCAHGVWLTEEDIGLLAATGTAICHNPSSNLRLRSGVAPVRAMLERGVTVAIGTDSTSFADDDDLFQEVRLADRLHRLPGIGQPPLSSHRLLEMATAAGAHVTCFGREVGALEPGRRADAVLVRLERIMEPWATPETDVIEALVHRARADDVDTVLVDGRVVVRHGRHVGIDRQEVVRALKEQLAREPGEVWRQRVHMAHALIPYIERFYATWLPRGLEPFYLYNSRV